MPAAYESLYRADDEDDDDDDIIIIIIKSRADSGIYADPVIAIVT